MTNQRTFGRRSSSPPQQPWRAGPSPDAALKEARPVFSGAAADQPSLPCGQPDLCYIKGEWPESEPATRARLRMPWRQLALMASLCFGIASWVLPDATNDALQWILYGLTAMSLFAGLSTRLQS
jgi:hypothetical protein